MLGIELWEVLDTFDYNIYVGSLNLTGFLLS